MKTSAYTPFEVDTKDRIVGFFVISALLLILIGFIIPAVERFSREDGLKFFTILDQTYGIARDATVSLVGVAVGSVTGVTITDDGVVRVDIQMSPAYQHFYTKGSRLIVDSNLAVSTLLAGSGLILQPGREANGLMEVGTHIPTESPRGFGSILEELDLMKLATQVTAIVENIESLTNGLRENQGKVYASLDHLEQVANNIEAVSRELPQTMARVNQSLASAQDLLESVDNLVGHTDEQLLSTFESTGKLAEQANSTLAEAKQLMKTAAPVLEQLPAVLVSTDATLRSVKDLSDKLSRSWLLGGRSRSASKAASLPMDHPHDDTLYEGTDPVMAREDDD